MLMLISAAGRQPPLQSGSAATGAAARGDDSKVSLVFCIAGECNYFGHGYQDCYCCGYDEAELPPHTARVQGPLRPLQPQVLAGAGHPCGEDERYIVQLSSEKRGAR